MDQATVDSLAKLGVPTLIGTLIGALITGSVAVYNSHNQHKKDEARRRDEVLVQPIVRFVDDLLRFVSRMHWSAVEGQMTVDETHLRDFRASEGSIRARLSALNDTTLTTAFDRFEQAWMQYKDTLASEGAFKAHEARKTLDDAASQIFARLYGASELPPPGA